jgi:hypothetical protein
MPRIALIGLIVAVATLVGCTGVTSDRQRAQKSTLKTESPRCCQSVEATPRRTAIVRSAARLVGARTIEINGRQIAYDCAGVTRAIYLEHGIDLYEGSGGEYKGNGVRLIYANVKQHGMLHQGPIVHPGDLVFFDNTWDLNGDGILNDALTHVGVVERVESDGTVVFISRVADAIERYRMNLALPHVHQTTDGRVLNDYIRRKRASDPEDMGHLTGELFAFYGTRLDR